MRDIEDGDLYALLEEFYRRLGKDELLAGYFEDLDMEAHMPRIEAFWSTALFGTARYRGNAFAPHLALEGLQPEHFRRWIETLDTIARERFDGPRVRRLTDIAHRIAYSMQLRLGLHPFGPYPSATPDPDSPAMADDRPSDRPGAKLHHLKES